MRIFEMTTALIGVVIGGFIGGLDALLYALLAFMIIDYLAGVLVAIARKKLSSKIGFRGICKKVLIIALVGIANIVDVQIIKTGSAIRTATIFFYIANEGISIIENAGNLGLPLPKKLVDVLEQLSDDNTASVTNDEENQFREEF